MAKWQRQISSGAQTRGLFQELRQAIFADSRRRCFDCGGSLDPLVSEEEEGLEDPLGESIWG